MFKFYYNTTKSFDQPSPTQPKGAITTYYKATNEELQLLKDYVYGHYKDMESAANELSEFEWLSVYGIELPNHRKRKGGQYTVADAFNDLNTQLETKDPTESMFTRWNDACEVLDVQDAGIELVYGMRPAVSTHTRLPNALFDFGE